MLKRSSLAALGLAFVILPGLSNPSLAIDCDLQPFDRIPKQVKVIGELIKLGSNYTKPGSYFEAAQNIYNILTAEPSAKTLYNNMVNELHGMGIYLRTGQIESDRDHALADLWGAIKTAGEYNIGNQPLPKDPVFEKDTIADVAIAYMPAMSDVWYDHCARLSGVPWTLAFTPLGQDGKPLQDGKPAYEWRFSVPYLMTAIALRLRLMDAQNLNWRNTNVYDQELHSKGDPPGHAEGLEEHWRTMMAGILCGDSEEWKSYSKHGQTYYYPEARYITCADVYSGLSASEKVNWKMDFDHDADLVADYKAELKSKLIEQLPLFSMRSMVDTLHFYVTHAPDLTAAYQRIPLAANHNLCLEAGEPAVLGTCNGTSGQKWIYDRTTHRIYNPRLNKCLEVQRHDLGHTVSADQEVQPIPSRPVVSADCAHLIIKIGQNKIETPFGAGPCRNLLADDLDHCWRYQEWSYDPDTGVITNAFGGVLDVQWGKLSSGTPIWIWDRNETTAQKWHADPAVSGCGVACIF